MKLPKFLRKKEPPRPIHKEETMQRLMAEAIAEYDSRPADQKSEESAYVFMQEAAVRISAEIGETIFVPPVMQLLDDRDGELVTLSRTAASGTFESFPAVAHSLWQMTGYGVFAVVAYPMSLTDGVEVFRLVDIESGRSVSEPYGDAKLGTMQALGRLAQHRTPEQLAEARAAHPIPGAAA